MDSPDIITLVEITMYPLDKEYEDPILDFIGRIRRNRQLDITVGETSTLIRGPYSEVMATLSTEMRTSLEGPHRAAFVLKVLNTERSAPSGD